MNPIQPIDYATPGAVRPPPKYRMRGTLAWLIFVTVAGLLFFWLKQASPASPTVPLSDFYDQVKAQNIARLIIDGDEVSGKLKKPITIRSTAVYTFRSELPAGVGGNWTFTQWLLENSPGTPITAEPANNVFTSIVLPLIPWVLILSLIWLLVIRPLRRKRNSPMPVVVVNREEV